MDITQRSLLTTALLGLTVASSAAFAGHCGGAKAHGAYEDGTSPVSHYRPAVYRMSHGDGDMRLLRVGHHRADEAKPMAAPAQADIVDIAASAGDFDTLVAAVKAAGLVETLKGEGPFTVFAPTDAAFAKIPKDKLNALLKDKDALVKVLTYHVVPGKVTASEVMKLSSAKTVEGQSITIDTRDGVKVDNARVIKTDIMAENGVIHVIDTVIMPN